MIARLTGAISQVASGAVLLRDASRASRRWQTYAVRAGFSAVLLTVLMLVIWTVVNAPFVDPANLSYMGRGMFVGFAVLQILLTTVIAPLTVARAIIEEREENTADLLMLTRLRPGSVLGGTFLARVLVLMMVVAGAMPILALVVTLGGVSVVEVVSVTLHALISVVVLGALGAFFAMFTRSPVLAAGAAWLYAIPSFLALPLLYAMAVFRPDAPAHVSPLYGTAARDWTSLLPILVYLPVVHLVFRVTTPVFELRMSRARLSRVFTGKVWASRLILVVFILTLIYMFTLLPFSIAASWGYNIGQTTGSGSNVPWLVGWGGLFGVWLFAAAANYLMTWAYMRIGMDMVISTDAYIARPRNTKERKGRVKIGRNPVLWREVNWRSFRLVFPALASWGLVLILLFQSGMWVIPGGLIFVGTANMLAAVSLSVWMLVGNVERERREGTLEILLTTTMSSWRILWAKVAGAMLPTTPLFLLGTLLLVLGGPHLALISPRHTAYFLAMTVGAAVWSLPLWFAVVNSSLLLALRLPKPRMAQILVFSGLGTFLVVPPVFRWIVRDHWLLAAPFRILTPPLVPKPHWWEFALSMSGMTFVGLFCLFFSVWRLRHWGADRA
ncbi:MAG: hypothetical protein EP330_22450 [Deltaproteobacteria bacterium]|nr:MAG: hypothetical protein EP330_22450 [Deltaproteobacteria bacterium]